MSQEQINQLGETFGFGTMVDNEILWFDGNPTELIRAAIMEALKGAIPARFEYVVPHVIYLRNDDDIFSDDWHDYSVLVLRVPE